MSIRDNLTPAERRNLATQDKPKKKKKTGLQRHELSACYPDIGDSKLKELAKSIKNQKQKVAIEIYEGKVLDGWQRYRACTLAKVEPWTVDVTSELRDEDLAEHVEILNGKTRRHLTVKTMAIAAAKLSTTNYCKNRAKASHGNRNEKSPGSKEPGLQSDQAVVVAANSVGVSVASTKRAAKVLKDGAKATVEALEKGNLSLSVAAGIASKPKSEQAAAVKAAQKPKPPKNGSVKPTKRVLFRACEKAFGELFRNAVKLGLDEDKYRSHFNAIIGEINRLGGKV